MGRTVHDERLVEFYFFRDQMDAITDSAKRAQPAHFITRTSTGLFLGVYVKVGTKLRTPNLPPPPSPSAPLLQHGSRADSVFFQREI